MGCAILTGAGLILCANGKTRTRGSADNVTDTITLMILSVIRAIPMRAAIRKSSISNRPALTHGRCRLCYAPLTKPSLTSACLRFAKAS